jgi:hypothetical protein
VPRHPSLEEMQDDDQVTLSEFVTAANMSSQLSAENNKEGFEAAGYAPMDEPSRFSCVPERPSEVTHVLKTDNDRLVQRSAKRRLGADPELFREKRHWNCA